MTGSGWKGTREQSLREVCKVNCLCVCVFMCLCTKCIHVGFTLMSVYFVVCLFILNFFNYSYYSIYLIKAHCITEWWLCFYCMWYHVMLSDGPNEWATAAFISISWNRPKLTKCLCMLVGLKSWIIEKCQSSLQIKFMFSHYLCKYVRIESDRKLSLLCCPLHDFRPTFKFHN